MAVLNLNWNKLHLGVVNTMLSSNLATCVFHFRGDRVSNSMGNWERCHRGSNHWSNRSMSKYGSKRISNNWGLINNSTRRDDQWISFSISFSLGISFTLANVMISIG